MIFIQRFGECFHKLCPLKWRIYQVVADSNFKYVLEIKDVPKFKDART